MAKSIKRGWIPLVDALDILYQYRPARSPVSDLEKMRRWCREGKVDGEVIGGERGLVMIRKASLIEHLKKDNEQVA